MDGREDRRLHQAAVGQRHEVVMAMDQVEFGGVLESFGDVKIFRDLGIDGAILFIALVDDSVQAALRYGIPRGEQSDVPATGRETFGDVTCNGLPGAVLPGRGSPGYRRQDSYTLTGH